VSLDPDSDLDLNQDGKMSFKKKKKKLRIIIFEELYILSGGPDASNAVSLSF
jgi:hypothetical protein